jgi:hypothetical protein
MEYKSEDRYAENRKVKKILYEILQKYFSIVQYLLNLRYTAQPTAHNQVSLRFKNLTVLPGFWTRHCSQDLYDHSVSDVVAIHSFVMYPVLRQVQSLFQTELSAVCDLVLSLSNSSILFSLRSSSSCKG